MATKGTLTVEMLLNYLRGLVDAGAGKALVAAREPDDNETMQWVFDWAFAINDGEEMGGKDPGILWLYLEDL